MSGISVLISVLDKLEELNISAADVDGFFNLYPSYLPTMHEDQLLDMMLNHRDRGFIECSVKFHPQWKTIGRTNTNCLSRPIYFKIKLLDKFYEHYSQIKAELSTEISEKRENISQENSVTLKNENYKLSKRQQEILQLYANGYNSRREIATEIGIKVTTMRGHENGIFKNLKTGNIKQAIKIASQHGLIN